MQAPYERPTTTPRPDAPAFRYAIYVEGRPAADFVKRQPNEDVGDFLSRCMAAAVRDCISYAICDRSDGREPQTMVGVTDFMEGTATTLQRNIKDALQQIGTTILQREDAVRRNPTEFAPVTQPATTGENPDGAAAAGEGSADA